MSDVILTALRNGDSQILFEWINNRELVLSNDNYNPVHENNHQAWFGKITNKPDLRIFAIRKKETNELIGTCQLYNIDLVNRSAELQIRIGNSLNQGKGYGSQAIKLLIEYGFNDLGLERIYLHVFGNNEKALRTYMKLNFIIEGKLRKAAYLNGKFHDIIVMSLLREDWDGF